MLRVGTGVEKVTTSSRPLAPYDMPMARFMPIKMLRNSAIAAILSRPRIVAPSSLLTNYQAPG
jgi:hypothetical protein